METAGERLTIDTHARTWSIQSNSYGFKFIELEILSQYHVQRNLHSHLGRQRKRTGASPGLLLRALAEVRRYHAGEVSWTTGHLQATLMTHGPSLDRRFPWRFSRRRKASKPIELEELVPWTSSCRWRPPRRSAGRLTRASCVASGVSSCAWRAPGMTRTPC